MHANYADSIKEVGCDYPFRCGRVSSLNFLETPQLVTGKMIIQLGMVLVLDGSVLVETFRAQV